MTVLQLTALPALGQVTVWQLNALHAEKVGCARDDFGNQMSDRDLPEFLRHRIVYPLRQRGLLDSRLACTLDSRQSRQSLDMRLACTLDN